MKQEQNKIRYSQALKEVGDEILLVAVISSLTIKLDFLNRKYKWMVEHDHEYKDHLFDLISSLENLQERIRTKLEQQRPIYDFLNEFGKNMQKKRKEENISLDELSERSYFDVEELESLEQGKYMITDLNDLDHLAKILNSSLYSLAGNHIAEFNHQGENIN